MSDIRNEIRTAFEREQSAFPPPAALREQVDAAVKARARAASPARQRSDRNLDWLMVAAAVLLTIAIVAGLLAARLMNFHPIPIRPGPILPLGSWTATGSMVEARSGHTATLLNDGKVLVAGGVFGNRVLASAELYDPGTAKWIATGSMHTARLSHTATLLPDGEVLVAGGFNHTNTDGSPEASAELYDPSTGKWRSTGRMVTPHLGHTATRLLDGRVLVVGGILKNSAMAPAEVYDPRTGRWAATGSVVTRRALHTATLLPDGKVLVAGGSGYTGGVANGGAASYLATAELYNPATRSWTATRSMDATLNAYTAIRLPDGRVLVGGGDLNFAAARAELYDPSTGTWGPTGDIFFPSAFRTATQLPDGSVLVLGDGGAASLYYPRISLWTGTAGAVIGSGATVTLLNTGAVLVAGGDIPSLPTQASAQLYHPTAVPVLPAAGVIAPGTYFMANPYVLGDPVLSCAVGCAAYSRIVFTLPAGWSTSHGLVYKHLSQPDEVAFSAWTVDMVYDDPCHWQRSSLSGLDVRNVPHAANGAIVLGPYTGGLAHQALRGPLPRALTALTLGSSLGGVSGSVFALRIDLSVPAKLDISTCDKRQFRSWTVWEVADGANSHHAPGQRDTVYQVDVDRRPLVIDVSHMPAASAADLAQLNAIVASMIIDGA